MITSALTEQMRKIKIVSRKYDKTLRDEYKVFLYAEDKETLVVYTPQLLWRQIECYNGAVEK